MTLADVGDHAALPGFAADVQEAAGDNVTLAFVDQSYTLHVVKLPEAERAFVLLSDVG